MDSDAAAVEASLGEPDRFGEVFDRNYGVVWAFLARLGGREAADEIASEVFFAAFRGRERYDPSRGSVRSWLYGIASNLLHRRFRSEERARRAFKRFLAEQVPVEGAGVDDAERAALVGQVREALSALSAADREIIVLAVWEELSYAEMAGVLGVAVGTVRSRLSRARGRLEVEFRACGEIPDVSGWRS